MFTIGEMFSAFLFGMISTGLIAITGTYLEQKAHNKRTARRQAIQSNR